VTHREGTLVEYFYNWTKDPVDDDRSQHKNGLTQDSILNSKDNRDFDVDTTSS
jgi:hypothetical protein